MFFTVSPKNGNPKNGKAVLDTAKQALHYLVIVKETLGDAWLNADLFRFGASALLNDVLMQLEKERTGSYQASEDFSKD